MLFCSVGVAVEAVTVIAKHEWSNGECCLALPLLLTAAGLPGADWTTLSCMSVLSYPLYGCPQLGHKIGYGCFL
jgi:hypothetical protein